MEEYQLIKDGFNENEYEFNKALESSDLKFKNIYFRSMQYDSLEFINIKPSQNITLITYTIGIGFSNSFLELVKMSSNNLKLRIAFCFTSNEEKSISKAINGFDEVFKMSDKLEIELIVNPNNHIKLLQFDSDLYLGSMNHSKTADDISISLNDTSHPEIYRNHELIVHFDKGGKDLTDLVWNQLKKESNSESFSINNGNYTGVLKRKLKNRKPLSKKESLKIDSFNTEMEKLKQKMVKREEIMEEVDKSMRLSMGIELNPFQESKVITIYSVDFSRISEVLQNENAECIITNFIDESSFINKDVLSEEMTEDWGNFISESTEVLDSLIFKEEELTEIIIEDRLDNELDDGESEPVWGDNSEKCLEETQKSNDEIVLSCYESIIEKLTEDIFSEEVFIVNLFEQ